MKLTTETKVNAGHYAGKRFQGCETFGDVQARLTQRETAGAYHYSQGWQVEVRTTTNAGRMKRVACLGVSE